MGAQRFCIMMCTCYVIKRESIVEGVKCFLVLMEREELIDVVLTQLDLSPHLSHPPPSFVFLQGIVYFKSRKEEE